jgi:hypothetical protein
MLKANAVAHFGTQQHLADALGLAQSTISGWPDVVPITWAAVIEKMTMSDGSAVLPVDLTLYDKVPPGLEQGREAA